jgi:hypothetical protein
MTEKEFEDEDPFEFVGVRYPVDPNVDSDEIMARCFIEEYALIGTPPDRIVQLFRSPFFAGTHAVFERRGAEFVQGIVNDVFCVTNSGEVS